MQKLQEMCQSLGQEDPLEEEMATHSSTLAWEIPRTEQPGGLQSMGLQSQTLLSTSAKGNQQINQKHLQCGQWPPSWIV